MCESRRRDGNIEASVLLCYQELKVGIQSLREDGAEDLIDRRKEKMREMWRRGKKLLLPLLGLGMNEGAEDDLQPTVEYRAA